MTGGDEISARDLYAKASTFKPFFSLLLQCNQKPKLNKVDKAIEERLKIIHYPFTFVDNPTHPEERHKDNNLKDLIINKEKSIFRIVKTIYSLMNNSYSFVLREGNT